MESASGIVPSWQLDKVERSLYQKTMVNLELVNLLEEIPSGQSRSGIIYSWQLELVGGSLNQLTMEQTGVVQLLELLIIYTESPLVIKS